MKLRHDDLVIAQGTSWEARWPVVNADDQTPAELDGWTVHAQARANRDSELVLHTWSTAAGNTSFIGSTISLHLEAVDSAALAWSTAFYDVELRHPDGRVLRITQGRITVDKEITK